MPSHPGVVHGDDRTVVAWPTLFRERVERRARKHGRFQWWVLWTALGGLFAVNVNFTIFAVALPRLARELDTTINVVTWTITAPLLAFGVVAPALGRAGDVFGHRRLFLLGLCGELVATVASAVAPNVGALIAARVLGAVLGAAVGSAGMAMILREFEADERVKALGYWSLIGAGGPVLGVALGGPLIEAMGWRAMFWAQLPAIVVAILVAGAILPAHPEVDSEDRTRRTLDWPGAATIALAALALLLALNRGPVMGFGHPLILAALIVVPLASAAFVRAERRSPDPLLPLEFLRLRNFSAPIAAQVFGNFTHMGGFILLPAMLDRVFGYGEARIGLLTISRPLAFAIAAPVAGYLAIRVGERIVAAGGCAAIVASMVMLSTIDRNAPDVLIIVALAIGGGGLGGASPALAATVANVMGDARLGVSSAAQQLTQYVGVVAGIQIMTTVQLVREESAGLIGSYSEAFLIGAGAAFLACVASLLLRSQPRDLANVADDPHGPEGPPHPEPIRPSTQTVPDNPSPGSPFRLTIRSLEHMPHKFLSEPWFAEVESLRDEVPPATGPSADLVLNIVVTGAPDGDVEVTMNKGQFERGLADDAPTKVSVPYDVAKEIFINGNQAAAMQAFMAGQIKVEGDMSRLMAMQAGGGSPTPEQKAFQEKLQAITE